VWRSRTDKAYSTPPDSLAVFKGAYFEGEDGGKKKGKRRGEGVEGKGPAPPPKKKYFDLELPLINRSAENDLP